MAITSEILMKLPAETMDKYTDYVLCQGTPPESLEELATHSESCSRCQDEMNARRAAKVDGVYSNKRGWWSGNPLPGDEVC